MNVFVMSNDHQFTNAWFRACKDVKPSASSRFRALSHATSNLDILASDAPLLLIFDAALDSDTTLSGLANAYTPGTEHALIISGPTWTTLSPDLLHAIEEGYAQFVAADAAPPLLDACRTSAVKRALAKRTRQSPCTRPVYASISRPLKQWGGLRSSAPIMHRLFRYLSNVAQTDDNLLIVGEPGVGKTFLARAVHDQSRRQGAPFVAFNAGAIPDTMVESELFGYRRGAFTGANRDKDGLLKQAHGGTLFVDEIGETSPQFQVKILSFLTDRSFYPLGSSRLCNVDVRIIFGTNQDIDDLVRSGRWRADFKSRISQNIALVPPLRERREDILVFAEHFLRQRITGTFRLTAHAKQAILSAQWPENLRELDNTLTRAANLVAHEADEYGVCTIDSHDLFPTKATHRSMPSSGMPTIPPQAATSKSLISQKLYEAILKARQRNEPTPHYKELAREYGVAVIMDIITMAMVHTQGKANAAGAHLGFYAPDNKSAAIAFTQWLRTNGTSASKLRRSISDGLEKGA